MNQEFTQNFDEFVEHLPFMWRQINTDGIILNCNSLYAKKLGYSKNQVLGKNIFDHVSEKSQNDLKKSFKDWSTLGHVKNMEIIMKTSDNEEFPVLLSAVGVRDEDGNMMHSSSMLVDVSEIRDASNETEWIKIKKLQAIGALSARIAHDFLNPMHIVKLATELIKSNNPELYQKSKSDFEKIDKAIIRMTFQVDNVLDYLHPKPLNIITGSTFEIVDSSLSKITIPDDVIIKKTGKNIKFQCDAYKIEIVLVNLVSNAIQAMNGKGIISIHCDDDENQIKISVSDSGSGIPSDKLEKIFDPLFTTRLIGTGLGLTSCKLIVEQHGGTINVETESGNGTSFIMSLPKK